MTSKLLPLVLIVGLSSSSLSQTFTNYYRLLNGYGNSNGTSVSFHDEDSSFGHLYNNRVIGSAGKIEAEISESVLSANSLWFRSVATVTTGTSQIDTAITSRLAADISISQVTKLTLASQFSGSDFGTATVYLGNGLTTYSITNTSETKSLILDPGTYHFEISAYTIGLAKPEYITQSQYATTLTFEPVPEPASLLSGGMFLGALIVKRRKKVRVNDSIRLVD